MCYHHAIALIRESELSMVFDYAAVSIIVAAAAVSFAACCVHIAHAAFDDETPRFQVRLALFWALAFAALVVGCLAATGAYGNVAAALYAFACCATSLVASRLLARSWANAETAEAAREASLRALVDRYRENEDSIERRVARAARMFDLTRREEEVLTLMIRGCTRAEIGQELVVSAETVKTHIRNVYRKLGVSGRDELTERVSGVVEGEREGCCAAAGVSGR